MTSLTLQRRLIPLLWSNGGIEDSGNNRRTNKSRLQKNTHPILIRREAQPPLSHPPVCQLSPTLSSVSLSECVLLRLVEMRGTVFFAWPLDTDSNFLHFPDYTLSSIDGTFDSIQLKFFEICLRWQYFQFQRRAIRLFCSAEESLP